MPNWVSTTLSVTGSKEEVQRFVDGVKDKQILESYVPCPAELRDTMSGFSRDEDVMNKLAQQQEENLAKFGHKDWYDWQYSVWGTKWGDCDTYFEPMHQLDNGSWEVQGYFQTAWGPAEAGFIKVSEIFPTLLFTFDYDEEAGFFAGMHAIQNGETVFESMYAPCEYQEEVDYDDDESIEKYEEWKEKMNDDIFTQYCEFLKEVSA